MAFPKAALWLLGGSAVVLGLVTFLASTKKEPLFKRGDQFQATGDGVIIEIVAIGWGRPGGVKGFEDANEWVYQFGYIKPTLPGLFFWHRESTFKELVDSKAFNQI